MFQEMDEKRELAMSKWNMTSFTRRITWEVKWKSQHLPASPEKKQEAKEEKKKKEESEDEGDGDMGFGLFD